MADPTVSESMASELQDRLSSLLAPPTNSPDLERVEPTAVYTFSRYVAMPQPAPPSAELIDEMLADEDLTLVDDVEAVVAARGSVPGVPVGPIRPAPPRSYDDFADGVRAGLAEAYAALVPAYAIWGADSSPRPSAGLSASEFGSRMWDALSASALGAWLRDTRTTAYPDPSNFDVAVFRVLVPDVRARLAARGEIDAEGREHTDLRPFLSTRRWERDAPTLIARILQAWADLTWPRPAEAASEETYPFTPTPANTVNLGIQLIYEQRWDPQGHQPGEVVRTVTLGPRQSEQVVVRRESRLSRSTTSEVSTEVETTTESSNSTRNSSDVVQEASSKLGWHAEASASASFGFGSASLTAGAAGEEAESSKETKSELNEAMQQSSARLRRTSRVTSAFEEEVRNEEVTTSELVNPNDGVAVTYLYSRLQMRYEVRTRLAKVRLCVFMAEPLPLPDQIDADWIRRHEWILSPVLLDGGLAQDLERVRTGVPDVESRDLKVTKLMDTIVSGGMALGDLAVTGSPPDVFAVPQEIYERETQRERVAKDAARSVERSVDRLRRHITDNVLHYWRAIVSAEDPDARLLRLQQRRFPIDWTCSMSASGRVEVCESHGSRTAPLAEIIAPNGPIGFAGNSAVYALSGDGRYPGLEAAAGQLRMPYLQHSATVIRLGGGDLSVQEASVGVGAVGPGRKRITWRDADSAFEVSDWLSEGGFFAVRGLASLDEHNRVAIDGVRVAFVNTFIPVDGDAFEIVLDVLPALEDPEIRQIREELSVFNEAAEMAFYSPETLARHVALFPELRGHVDVGATWEGLDPESQDRVRRRRAEFVLRERHTEPLSVDSNQLMLSLLVDSSQSLEPFKAAHRFVDVLAAYADTEGKRIENRRRQARVDADQLGDPDIDRLTVVQPGTIGGLVDLDDNVDDPPP